MRKIIHIDADAFYASVEERDNPSLKHVPLAVGGNPSGRGVVATCNYIARSFGVHSAMPSSHALRLCPDLNFVRPRFSAYRAVSQQMHEIFKRYTHVIEPLSLDEAYLDVSNTIHCKGSATLIAQSIQRDIIQEVGISVSAGVAPNKFLAKVASDWKKPEGLFVIHPKDIDSFVRLLPVKKINGVGKVTEQKLKEMGIETCEDLSTFSEQELTQRFGKYGKRLSELARGIDERVVSVERVRKSLSTETTLENNIQSTEQLDEICKNQYTELLKRAEKLKPDQSVSARYVKLKFSDFTQTTMEEALHVGLESWQDEAAFSKLLKAAWERKSAPVRLVGLGLRIGNTKKDKHQLDLFTN